VGSIVVVASSISPLHSASDSQTSMFSRSSSVMTSPVREVIVADTTLISAAIVVTAALMLASRLVSCAMSELEKVTETVLMVTARVKME